jgi:predicted outer membrane repeat protein
MKKGFLLSCVLVLLMVGTSWGSVWYVTPDGSDLGAGQSWDDAFQTIQKAIDTALVGDEIWVGAGTYLVDDYILVDEALSMYGGFNGTETQRDERDWTENVTIVDGQNAALCFYVVADARVDGFTIRNGYSYYFAGGLYNGASSVIANCTFSENSSRSGGGIYNTSDSSPTILNCKFFRNRTTSYDGGAIRNSSGSFPTIINCIFHGNTATRSGGAIYNSDSSPAITNCTFYGNMAENEGGAIHNYFYSSPIVTNSVFWGNQAPRGSDIYDSVRSYPSVAYSDIQEGYAGEGNISTDPGFTSADEGDFHLLGDSPCIDTGTNDVLSLPPTDFEGDPRIAGAQADMGVDEFVEKDSVSGLEAYVLYGKERVRLCGIADSRGNVGSNGWIKIAGGLCGTIEGNLYASEGIKVRGSITINGDVFTNGEIRISGRRWQGELKVTGQITEEEATELTPMELPSLSFVAGGKDIRVGKGRCSGLEPGSYGEVRVRKGASLSLSSGEYSMERLTARRDAIISIDASDGPVTINVVERLRVGRHAKIEVVSGKTDDVTINVLNSRVIWMGSHAKFEGTLVAPNSLVSLGYGSQLKGAVFAKRVWAGRNARFQPHDK